MLKESHNQGDHAATMWNKELRSDETRTLPFDLLANR